MRSLPLTFCVTLLVCGLSAISSRAADHEVGPVLGDRVPDFELPIVGSDSFLRLSDEYDQGKVVVIMLRGFPGYQCPICSRQVSAVFSRAKTLGMHARRVILVYPGPRKDLKKKAEQFIGSKRIPAPVVLVRDDEMRMAEQWNLRWDMTRETAYPSTFVIDTNGRLKWKKTSDSHAGRSTVEEILTALKKRTN